MRCPVCIERNLRSKVFSRGSTTTMMGGSSYYDEEGVYHSHDPNTVTTQYKCNYGHIFNVKRKLACPAEDCDYGKNDDGSPESETRTISAEDSAARA